MADYVFDDLTLPAGKEDARALTGSASQNVTSAEWNQVMSYIDDLRDAVRRQQIKTETRVAVSGSGSDAAKSIEGGDYTGTPFLTLEGAMGYLPKILSAELFVEIASGSFAGCGVFGFSGGSYSSAVGDIGLNFQGATSLATLTTGVNNGTAGSGSNSTTLVKPTGSPDWTASNLVGKWLKVTGGGGYVDARHPVFRPIKANTTTNATVDAISGMDATTTFQIVDLATTITARTGDTSTCFRVGVNTAPIRFTGLKLTTSATNYGWHVQGAERVIFDGCELNMDATVATLYAFGCRHVSFQNCIIKNSANAQFLSGPQVSISNVWSSGAGMIEIQDILRASVSKLDANGNATTTLKLKQVQTAAVEAKADSCTATPFVFESVAFLEATGSNKLTGASNTGGATYGIQIDKSGRYTLTGSNVTGAAGDVLFMNRAVTWTNLNSAGYGIVEEHASSAMANASYTKAIKYGNYLYDGSIDVSGRLLLYGYFNTAANLTPATLTGTDSLDMETGLINGVTGVGGAPRGTAEIVCNSASAKAILPSGAAIAGVPVIIINRGSQTLTVEPPSGGTINGGASTTIASGAGKLFVSLNGASGKDFWVVG